MIVHIPSPLQSYTDQKTPVEVRGATLREVLKDLDRSYPGFAFRVIDEQGEIREHIRFFLESQLTTELDKALKSVQEIHIICALSGG